MDVITSTFPRKNKWPFSAPTTFFLLLVILIVWAVGGSTYHGWLEDQQYVALRSTFEETRKELDSQEITSPQAWDVNNVALVLTKHHGDFPLDRYLLFKTNDGGDFFVAYENAPDDPYVKMWMRGGAGTSMSKADWLKDPMRKTGIRPQDALKERTTSTK